MTDGSTLPTKFKLTYDDGSPLPAPILPEDLTVLVRNADFSQVFQYNFGTDVSYDSGNNQYLLSMHTQELNLAPGTYSIKVIYKGVTWGTINFQIVETDKAKGNNK